MSGDIAAAWIEQRCRSSAVGDIDWDQVVSAMEYRYLTIMKVFNVGFKKRKKSGLPWVD